MNKSIYLKRIKVFALFILLSGCSLSDQIVSMKNLSHCQFKLGKIENISLAGVDVSLVKVATELNIIDKAKIFANIATGRLPLKFRINIEANNPNPVKAGESIYIEGLEFTENNLVIELLDLNGHTLKSEHLFTNQNAVFQVPNLPTGVYIIEIRSINGKACARIMVQ